MNKIKAIVTLALICAIGIVAIPINTAKADGTFIWDATVSSWGTSVNSPTLESGVLYRIVAIGTFWYDLPNRLPADAQYYSTTYTMIREVWADHLPAPDGHSFLQINDGDVDWGPFNSDHNYTYYCMGEGTSISFKIVDWIDGNSTYPNQLCHIDVEIYRIERGEGFTPGYWKNHPEDWESYAPSDLVGAVFDVFGTMPDEYHCDLGDYTLMEALNFGGGPGLYGAAKILLRAATAAILNGAHSNVTYSLTDSEVISLVNNALESHNRDTIIDLAEHFDFYNNLGGSIGTSRLL